MKLRFLPQLDARLPDPSPLGYLLNIRQGEEEFSRLRTLATRYAPFHLKHSVTSEVNGRRHTISGKPLLNFGCSSYLSLEQHPEVLYAAKRAIDELGTQSGSARDFTSHQNLIELEATLARIAGSEATLVSHNVAQIHAAALPALFGDNDCTLFLDEYAQPHVKQAAELAQAKGARLATVNVTDLPSLRKVLEHRRKKFRGGALVVDAIYGMRESTPEFAQLSELCAEFGLVLYIDDSHGIGVLGKRGGGAVEVCGLDYKNLIVAGSLEHAFGSYGGFLAAKAPVVDFLRVMSKSYIATSTLQPAAVEGALAAARIASSEEGRRLRQRLQETSTRVRVKLKELGFRVPTGSSPVLPIYMGREWKTLMASRKLFDHGIFVNTLLAPAVPHGNASLLVSLTTLHNDHEIERLLFAFAELREYLLKHENPLRQVAHMAFELGKAKWLGSHYAGL